ncbi:zinc metalloprotease HtpX [Candidatus Shapirobacteria bacterium CG08_land_8_20_14_0_20_39_18]|uniref:Protease HtpX homolog n=1 Tax=Candidatus Shapirobacteria bacterium CG08_land_8_20_14_0_20_39_18 TaxID=1974883 RepID=A0A2M6XBX9_9BACT|nr:MAG: zinc metalloprotease HtpX [Candidatus Shapirobacteria bacterium CG08_land_8_20_14_0_20_39_18]PIY65321.1 MAG: zinc metalloprotease HtpX [Candidatus Shapirobacteria bacterium CG_4_10_14_0_8_um_filter_39_15]PJE68474.1 MAG: zinc metalloprotease HtpX [Candidatus Shapirobacteria bacterium CG10_big_fil_rev_8_21_14_0_10_38_8]
MINVYEQVDQNKRRSLFIIVIFIAFIVFVTWTLSMAFGYGLDMVGFALIFAGVMSFASYWYGDKIILTISGAKPANRKDFFNFYTVTENLCLGADMPMPKLFVIDDTAPNAFATGRDPQHAVVCATTGLLSKLSRTELEGVVAHELSHVRNYDTRLMAIVAILVGMLALLADWLIRGSLFRGNRDNREERGNMGAILFLIGIILAILSPIIAQLIQLAISRRREFLADASGVLITKYPEGLISALEKISADQEPLEAANRATAHLYIVNPFKGKNISSLFNTHPPIQERIKALKEME